MGEKSASFLKGGVGCIALFVILALSAVLVGGSAHADLGGLILLFVVGGVLGLVVLAIYNKGRRDAEREDDGDAWDS